MPSQFLNLLPNRLETAFRAACCVSLLLIDLTFMIQLDLWHLSNNFSILYIFSTKIVGGDNVNHLVTKITRPLLAGSKWVFGIMLSLTRSANYKALYIIQRVWKQISICIFCKYRKENNFQDPHNLIYFKFTKKKIISPPALHQNLFLRQESNLPILRTFVSPAGC